MKVLVIGGVAAGTKAAAKLKREDRSLEVKIITSGHDISYAGCGLPYYIGGLIPSRDDLIVNTPAKFSALTGVEVVTDCTATAVDFVKRTVTCRTAEGETEESYDRLVIATGAGPVVPPVPGTGLEGVFTLRTVDDALRIRDWAGKEGVKRAVVAGAGFIGLEVAHNLKHLGLDVTVIDMADQIMPSAMDAELAAWVARRLKEAGIRIQTSTRLREISGTGHVSAVVTDSSRLECDLVILALGVRPNTAFLEGSGLELSCGAVVVNSAMETNMDGVYAAGDCALVTNRITGEPLYSAMGSTANLSGRVLAQSLAGRSAVYPGALATGVVKLLDNLNAGRTGLGEEAALKAGYDIMTAVAVTDDKAHYYPDSSFFIMKLIAERKTHRILGFQVLGGGSVDKVTDIAVVAVSQGMRVEDFDCMDFSYAPPFSTAISPFVQLCSVMENKLSGAFETITPLEYLRTGAKGYRVVDVLPQRTIPGAFWVDLDSVTGPVDGLGKDEKLLLVCSRGKRGYFLQKGSGLSSGQEDA